MKGKPVFFSLRCLGVLCLSGLLSACGYSAGGIAASAQSSWPSQLQRLSLSGLQRHDPLYQSLASELRAYGIRLASAHAATANLRIIDRRETARTVSYDQRAKSHESLISLKVVFSLSSPQGKVLLRPQTVFAESVQLYDVDRYLASRSERRATLEALHRRLSQNLLRRLAAAAQQLEP